jgi:hypothetical protein
MSAMLLKYSMTSNRDAVFRDSCRCCRCCLFPWSIMCPLPFDPVWFADLRTSFSFSGFYPFWSLRSILRTSLIRSCRGSAGDVGLSRSALRRSSSMGSLTLDPVLFAGLRTSSSSSGFNPLGSPRSILRTSLMRLCWDSARDLRLSHSALQRSRTLNCGLGRAPRSWFSTQSFQISITIRLISMSWMLRVTRNRKQVTRRNSHGTSRGKQGPTFSANCL